MTEQQEIKGSIQVIERMVSLLDALAERREPACLKTLAQATGLHPSTAHRILAAMTHSRLAERYDANNYVLGMRLLTLGNLVKARLKVREIALPFMEQLHVLVGESVNLGIRDEDEIIYIERTASGRSVVRVFYPLGARAPLHLTSLGKLFLAAENSDAVAAYAKRTGLPGQTVHSLTSLKALSHELNIVREQDFAYDNEEVEIGLRCLAAPIRNDQAQIIAGLSISAPADRHDPTWVERVKETGAAISTALGFER